MSLEAPTRAWIIGGAGFLGSALGAQCKAEGWRVLVVDPACAEGEEGVAAPAGQPGVLEHAARLLAPQLIFFCAATRGGDAAAYCRAYEEPVRRSRALAPHARLVFCSSSALYAGPGVVTEQSPTPADTERKQALLAAEAAVLRAGGAVARLAALYGPGRCELLRRHLAGEPQLPGEPGRVLNYVHVDDAARALLLLAGAEGVFNVCAESFCKEQVYTLLESLTGVRRSVAIAPAGRRGRADHCVCAERLRVRLGWAPQVRFCDFVKDRLSVACPGGEIVI